MMLRAVRYRVRNFRNIDDSGWITLERVTAFVGRNESGKTTLLKALHKFNPATPEPFNAQKEFPRDRFKSEFKDGKDWPVSTVEFEISPDLKSEIEGTVTGLVAPSHVRCTRFYDGHLEMEFLPPVAERTVEPSKIVDALKAFAKSARRIPTSSPDQEEQVQKLRTELAAWASGWQEKLASRSDLRDTEGVKLLKTLRQESESRAKPESADAIEALQEVIDPALVEVQKPREEATLRALIERRLPVLIYFENYGVLDSAIYLPMFLQDLKQKPTDPRVRTINAMFKHVNIGVQEIATLGQEKAQQARVQGKEVTPEMIAYDQAQKENRAIQLNAASLDITKRFTDWYPDRRHTIEYQADGDYFRIWIADDRRPGVKIELEARSKGFQWFFSFYLVFLVESDEGHKDAILLLDEPGLHLHPTAQQRLISFFEGLAEKNQLLYTTHSPFLVDGEHIHRVRPVIEDETGHSRISADGWPGDRETIFPLQAAAGYAMVRGLFQNRKNVLLEGMSDYYYLHALASQCRRTDRRALPDDVYLTPCGGTKLVGHIASLFLGQGVRPLTLLDGDAAGRARRDALVKELYAGHLPAILMLDEALGRSGSEIEIEDIFGEDVILPAVGTVLGRSISLSAADRAAGSLPSQVRAWALREGIQLPDGWKASVALQLVGEWAERRTILPDEVLDRASQLFQQMHGRFEQLRVEARGASTQ